MRIVTWNMGCGPITPLAGRPRPGRAGVLELDVTPGRHAQGVGVSPVLRVGGLGEPHVHTSSDVATACVRRPHREISMPGS